MADTVPLTYHTRALAKALRRRLPETATADEAAAEVLQILNEWHTRDAGKPLAAVSKMEAADDVAAELVEVRKEWKREAAALREAVAHLRRALRGCGADLAMVQAIATAPEGTRRHIEEGAGLNLAAAVAGGGLLGWFLAKTAK